MAAVMCIELKCQPRDLPVRALQQALLNDPQAPAAIVPLFNLIPNHPDWLIKQLYYLDNLNDYLRSRNHLDTFTFKYSYGNANTVQLRNCHYLKGIFRFLNQQYYRF